jgi:hypothetical protein
VSPQRWTDLPLTPDRRNAWRNYVFANAFEAMLGVSAVVSGVAGLVRPVADTEQTALGTVFGALAVAWSVLYVLGGVAIVVGLARRIVRVEVAGLWIIAGAIIAQSLAIALLGWQGIASAVFYLGWGIASGARAWRLTRVQKLVTEREAGGHP